MHFGRDSIVRGCRQANLIPLDIFHQIFNLSFCGNYYLWRIFGNYDLSDIDIVCRNMYRFHIQAEQIPAAYRDSRFRRHMPDAVLYGSKNRGG